MRPTLKQIPADDIKVEEIIRSLTNYAIRDIRVNLENPIAAFILGSCLIDQLASFRYNPPRQKLSHFYKQFIKDYLTNYDPLSLYENLRCLLVHGYSISRHFGLNAVPFTTDELQQPLNVNNLSIHRFLYEIEIAFQNFSDDIRGENQEARRNALERYSFSPPLILVDRASWQYDEAAADYLVTYYKDLIIGRLMNSTHELVIDEIRKVEKGDIYLVWCICKKEGREWYANLDFITHQLRLPYPTDKLREVGLFKQ